MPSYSTSLKLELMDKGSNSNSWGTVTNTNLGTTLEQAIVGRADISMSSTTITLSLTNSNAAQDARAIYLNLTGSPGGAAVLEVPAVQKPYIVKNGSDQQVTIKVTGLTGVVIPVGKTVLVYNNGTDVVTAVDYIPSLTLGAALPVASGGTGVTSSTGTGSVVLSTSPTLTTPTLGAASATSVALDAGAAGTPSLTAIGDLNTGMWFPAADTIAWSTGGSERMRVDASSRLVLNGTDATVGGGQMVVNHGANNGLVVNQTGSGTGAQIYLRNAVDSIINGINFTNPGVRFYDIGTATERMRLDSSGNVGIGTTAPQAQLQVAATSPTRGITSILGATGSTGVQLQMTQAAIEDWVIGQPAGVSAFAIWSGRNAATDGNERMRLDSSGNLGIGTSSPTARLHVGASGGTIQLRLGNNTGSDYWGIGRDNVTTGDLVFQGQTTEYMRLTASGNLGLGTSSPGGYKISALTSPGTTSAARFSNTTTAAEVGVSSGGGGQAYFGSTTNHLTRLIQNNTTQLQISTAGLVQMDNGYGSLATFYGCRAWINFDGTAVTNPASMTGVRGSGNISSVLDNGTGDYTVNFTNSMPDANYAVLMSSKGENNTTIGSNNNPRPTAYALATTGSVRIFGASLASVSADAVNISVAIYR